MQHAKLKSPSPPLDIDWQALATLTRIVKLDKVTQALVISHGGARIVLSQDGAIRIEGGRIVQLAERDITLNAPIVKVN